MGFMRHIQGCNRHNPASFVPFLVHGYAVGKMRPEFARNLLPWPEVFGVTDSAVELLPATGDLQQRSTAVANILQQLIDENVLDPMHGELYAATDENRNNPRLLMDRAMAPYFGIRAYGQHLNGFVRTSGGLKLWIARRAKDRLNYPGCLDNFVAGGLPHGLSLAQNMAKECWEEASVPAHLAAEVIPAGAVSYNVDTTKGFNPFTLYCYDLELPRDFVPHCTDGEVESFTLMPVAQVMEIVKTTDEFKLNCNLVIIDFLIRQGYIGPEDDEYLQLLGGLHPSSP